MTSAKKVAIYGSGPTGLMAATRLLESKAGLAKKLEVHLFEKRSALGRKLLIAGSSGLNISHDTRLDHFVSHYEGFTPELWTRWLSICSPQDWVQWVERLGFETFVGTSSRYFVREMKASGLLKAWITRLQSMGAKVVSNQEWATLSELDGFDAIGMGLGGGSWEEVPPQWTSLFETELGVKIIPFQSANVGYEVAWSSEFLAEAEGKPLKNIILKCKRGEKAGELMVTRYGLEGTPIYFLGGPGQITLDLKPALSTSAIRTRLNEVTENLSPLRRVKKQLQLCEASMALLFHHTSSKQKGDLETLISLIKNFPIELIRPRPLLEAISSSGGVDLNEIETSPNREFRLKKHSRIFCAGEMLDWSAPTGGFLIQGCITQGAVMAESILKTLGLS